MFKDKKGWFGWGSKPKNPHSLDQLKYLYHVMSKNPTVSEQNKTLLVETLRSIAEILIWGDQNDSSVFDFFLEKNMLSFFLRIMKQKCGSYVCVQLLQTLNILFENIRNETSLYYLLSNNHVNSIIEHKFDFSDEEVMAYYISFLKTLSLKLNSHTIHFFFNEHTNDFPLYTEAIKFFNHSEKMVRIAVRTLTLNVFRVDEKSMLKFITDRTAVPYFSNLVWFIGNHVLEIDSCLSSPEKTQQMVVKLDDLVAEHLDHLHYLNDILLLKIDDLNAVLTDHLLNRLLIPLYIYSLIPHQISPQNELPKVPRPQISRIISLFLLSQVFLIISYESLVQKLISILFHGNISIFEKPEFSAPPETLEESLIQVSKSTPVSDGDTDDNGSPTHAPQVSSEPNLVTHDEEMTPAEPEIIETRVSPSDSISTNINEASITDEEKAAAASCNSSNLMMKRMSVTLIPDETRPFLEALFDCLDCNQTNDDHAFMFSLCLIHAVVHNQGLNESHLCGLVVQSDASDPSSSSEETPFNILISRLTQIMHLSCQYNSRIRLVTLEMSISLLLKLVMRDGKSILSDQYLASVEQAKEEAALILRNFYKSEEEAIFLDLFEEEFLEFQKRKLNVEYLMMDANLLLPPNQLTSLMMNGVDLSRRLPCAELERTRYAIRVFFMLRRLSLTLRQEEETQLPLSHQSPSVQMEQLLDLNNSDLIACTVVSKDSSKTRRFMVIDAQQLILIEPDNRKLGFGVAKYVALLQDVEVNVDKDDSRSLHLTIRERSGPSKRVSLSAKFIFDDHIRCLAAKQRLTKGRMKARQKKMYKIAKLIELGSFPPVTGSSSLHSRRLSSSSGAGTSTSSQNMTRSQSQEAFNRRRHINSHRPVCRGAALPGVAVATSDTHNNTSHLNNFQQKTDSRQQTLVTAAGGKRRSSSHARHGSRESSPKPPSIESSIEKKREEMIPLEDLSPKDDRRRIRSKSENRLKDSLLSSGSEGPEDSERV